MVGDKANESEGPLKNLDEWEDDLRLRYPDGERGHEGMGLGSKSKEQFRDYRRDAKPNVKEFYRLNHRYQTVDFVRTKRNDYLRLNRRKMGLWDGLDFLNTLVDDSDPDTSLTQIDHLFQTAEAIRRDGHPRWFILTGLIHDFGKVLCLFGEPQWAVVGDTFPVGCAYSDSIIWPEFLADNSDSQIKEYQSTCGIYEEGCGLDNVMLSWGHDEYMYHVTKDYLPTEALYMIRFHSFYPGHREGAYQHLMNDQDRKYFNAVRAFNPYDLYTKSAERPNVDELRSYYEELWNEYLPKELAF